MRNITVRMKDEDVDLLDDRADEAGVSRSDYVRNACLELPDEVDELRERLDELETERDRLQRELRASNRRYDDHTELVEYVQEERSLARRRHNASAIQRAKWWLFGGDD